MADDEKAAALAAQHDEDVAAHKAAVEASAPAEELEFHDAGYDETIPGQTEIVAGSVEHTQLLNSYSNATSYGPDVNVQVSPPPPEEEPPAEEQQ